MYTAPIQQDSGIFFEVDNKWDSCKVCAKKQSTKCQLNLRLPMTPVNDIHDLGLDSLFLSFNFSCIF